MAPTLLHIIAWAGVVASIAFAVVAVGAFLYMLWEEGFLQVILFIGGLAAFITWALYEAGIA